MVVYSQYLRVHCNATTQMLIVKDLQSLNPYDIVDILRLNYSCGVKWYHYS